MFPMRSRQQNILPLGSWATNAIGKAYIHIHSKLEFQYYCHSPRVVPGKAITEKVPVEMVNDVFSKGILNIIFLTYITLIRMTTMP